MSSDGDNPDNSLSTFIAALVFNVALGAAFYLLFVFCYPRHPSVYAPKSYTLPAESREPPLSVNPLACMRQTSATPAEAFIQHAGLDAYVFVRYLEIAALLFVVFSVIALPVLIPIDLIGQSSTLKGIDQFTIGNVTTTARLYVHALMGALFVGLVIFALCREMSTLARVRQKYMTSPGFSTSVRGRTMLVTGVAKMYKQPQYKGRLEELFNSFGRVENLQRVPQYGKVVTRAQKRDAAALSLEGAECAYIATGKRPMVRKGMPLCGAQVDAITHWKDEFTRLSAKHKQAIEKVMVLETIQDEETMDADTRAEVIKMGPSAAFVTYSTQREMQAAAQSVLGRMPWRMAERWPNVMASDVIWANLGAFEPVRYIRRLISAALSIFLVIIWSVLVAFVSSIATLSNLTTAVKFLEPINDLPSAVVGIIQGVLPAVAVAILMFLLPIFLKMLCHFEGIPLMSELQLSLMHKYFFFLVVNVLLVVTFASGIFSALGKLINNPQSALTILAESMPKASTVFLTFVLLNAFTTLGQLVLQIVKIILHPLLRRYFSSTPRSIWALQADLDQVEWGIIFPPNVLIFAMGILYSTIQPIILPLVAIYFFLYAFAYRYLFLYVYSKYGGPAPYKYTLLGRAFPRAVMHTFVALYIYELTMIGILVLKETVGPPIIMFAVLIATIIANRYLDSHYQGLNKYVAAESMLPRMPAHDNNGAAVIETTALEEEQAAESSLAPRPPDTTKSSTYNALITPQPAVNTAYLPPAFYKPAPLIWLPRDANGLADAQVQEINQVQGLAATTEGAAFTDGKIHIDPDHVPDEFHS